MNVGVIVIKLAMVGLIVILAVPTVQLIVNTDINSSDDSLSDDATAYCWFGTSDRYEISLSVSEDVYHSYQNIKTFRFGNDYQIYKFVTPNDAEISDIADQLKDLSSGMNDVEISNFVNKFVSKLVTYVSDDESHGMVDYYQFPYETVFLRTGDCEDFSLLYASIMESMGYDCVLVCSSNHVMVGVAVNGYGNYVTHHGRDYYLMETTSQSHLGDASVEVKYILYADGPSVLSYAFLLITYAVISLLAVLLLKVRS
jgi:hypothetical protein